MTYDVDTIRRQFPALIEGTAHFDGPGGTQTPQVVADAVGQTLALPISNQGTVTRSARRAAGIVEAAREAMADFLGAEPNGIVFGRSMTQITYDVARTLAKTWSSGDEVVVSRLDHDANIRPWVQAAEAVGATVRWIDFNPGTAELGVDDVRAALSARTKVVALTAASNLIGTMPPIAEIATLVHDTDALLYVDAVHYAAHALVDLDALGADFVGCSPYKFCGPHLGVLAARPGLLQGLHPDKLLPASDEVPERFEFGTLPYELLAGVTACVDFLADLATEPGSRRERLAASFAAIEDHENALRQQIEERLGEIDGLRCYSRAAQRTPTLLVEIEGRPSAEVAAHLARQGVNAPARSFYALEASRRLGLGDEGAVRIGLAPYTNQDDVDRLVDGLTG